MMDMAVILGRRWSRRFCPILSSRSQAFPAVSSLSVGFLGSLGTGRVSEPVKWPQQSAASIATQNRILKAAQLLPLSSSRGTRECMISEEALEAALFDRAGPITCDIRDWLTKRDTLTRTQ